MSNDRFRFYTHAMAPVALNGSIVKQHPRLPGDVIVTLDTWMDALVDERSQKEQEDFMLLVYIPMHDPSRRLPEHTILPLAESLPLDRYRLGSRVGGDTILEHCHSDRSVVLEKGMVILVARLSHSWRNGLHSGIMITQLGRGLGAISLDMDYRLDEEN